jgi:hypothetical protein
MVMQHAAFELKQAMCNERHQIVANTFNTGSKDAIIRAVMEQYSHLLPLIDNATDELVR